MIYLKALSDMVVWLSGLPSPDQRLVRLHQVLSEHIVNLEDLVKQDVKTGGALELKKLIISLQDDRDRGLSTLPHSAPVSPSTRHHHQSKFLAKVSEVYKSSDPSIVLGTPFTSLLLLLLLLFIF